MTSTPLCISVTELKCACLDPAWRKRWMAGEKPDTRSYAGSGNIPVNGALFHQIVETFVGWLASDDDHAPGLTSESLWREMYERFAESRIAGIFEKGQVDPGYHLTQALKAFCKRVGELRDRNKAFTSWRDIFIAGEFPLENVKIDLESGVFFISGRPDVLRFHPEYDLEVVDYKLNRGSDMKQDLLQLAIYSRLLSIVRPGLRFHGTLEYYEPELREISVSADDLHGLFDDMVLPVLNGMNSARPSSRNDNAGNTHRASTPNDKEAAPPEVTASPHQSDGLSDAIRKCYASFKLNVEVIGRQEAPQLVRYRVKPSPGVKVVSLANRMDDLRVALSLPMPPMISPEAGCVVIDIPKNFPDTVFWREVIKNDAFTNDPSPVSFPVGVNVNNQLIMADFADTNTCHAAVAGASGSGKSEFLKSMVASLIYKNTPETLKLSIIDPKILTFGGLASLPHLTESVITDINDAISCLTNAVDEMDHRYHSLHREGYENLSSRFADGKRDIPFYVILFDEFADLILAGKTEKKEFETLVAKLAAKGRAAGIHLVLATQRPDRNILNGLIKANLPLKICMRVANAVNSNIVLDQPGGEKLLGRGDLLCDRGKGLERAQSPYIPQDEVRELVKS